MKEEECIHCLHWNEDSGDLQPCRVDMLSEQEIDYCVVSQTHTHTHKPKCTNDKITTIF